MLFRSVISTHYDNPPFWQSDGQGLTQLLASKLTQLGQGSYTFSAEILPRKRLDVLIANPQWAGIIPWVIPAWFGDSGRTNFHWTAPLMQDADLVVSKKPIDYNSSKSLIGLRFGGILGHRYLDIEPLIDGKKIVRQDTKDLEANLRKLDLERIDFTFIPKSTWEYLRTKESNPFGHLITAKRAREIYELRLLVHLGDPKLEDFLAQAIQQLARDSEWQRAIQTYSYAEPKSR